jgi:glucose-fructose oxidoreductase
LKNRSNKRVRYAVVGLGHIAQAAVLPAFAHAGSNSELTALVSGSKAKLRALGRRYKVGLLWTYREFLQRLQRGEVDACYIALPNQMHRDYCLAACGAGVHVLCEKPLGLDSRECLEMIRASELGGVQLMCAYRLHFDPLTLQALRRVRKGELGELRCISAELSLTVRDPGNVRRLPASQGGGPLYDLGVYCINAARTFFQAEPVEATAFAWPAPEREQRLSGLLRFPGGRLAAFSCGSDLAERSSLVLCGSEGSMVLENAFDYAGRRSFRLERPGKGRSLSFGAKDQFAPELLHFSDCVLHGRQPGPSGFEGLADVRVIEALRASAAGGRSQELEPFPAHPWPRPSQAMQRPAVRKRKELGAKGPKG